MQVRRSCNIIQRHHPSLVISSPVPLCPVTGNNRISELREAQRLRGLPKLIILDLSGNPCTGGASASGAPISALAAAAAAAANDDYRLYVIYNVRKLKVR